LLHENINRQLRRCEGQFLRQLILILGLLCAFAAPADNADSRRLDGIFPRSALTIATPDARLHHFTVWVADDDKRRSLGLMFVKELDADAGMLFVYPQPQQIAMWMKNTLLPLDMVFVAADGRVANVVENTIPQSLKTIESSETVLGVIELNAGTAKRLHIHAGARVGHPAFEVSSASTSQNSQRRP
jgi:uncharacterized membrane protein (UPF0127 family)